MASPPPGTAAATEPDGRAWHHGAGCRRARGARPRSTTRRPRPTRPEGRPSSSTSASTARGSGPSSRPGRGGAGGARTRPCPEGARRVPWPATLAARLDGRARIVVSEHVSGRVHHDSEHSFGTVGPAHRRGRRRGPPPRHRQVRRPRADLRRPLHRAGRPAARRGRGGAPALSEAGLEPFLCYGTLLGAVRDGRLIGHDDDADLATSAGTTTRSTPPGVLPGPAAPQPRGYRTRRYSGLAFKVEVAESDDLSRGLDVFGGFMTHGRLYLMGAVGLDYRPEWIAPRGTTVLEGRRLPVPADPERLLAAMYGASWRVPDPSFHHVVPAEHLDPPDQLVPRHPQQAGRVGPSLPRDRSHPGAGPLRPGRSTSCSRRASPPA